MEMLEKHGTVYGYARVSSKDQCLNRQLDALKQFPVDDQYLYADTASGKDFNRPQYRRLVHRLKPHDILVVKSIDRLGRNYNEIIEQWRLITKEKQVYTVVLDMPLLDTRTAQNGITGVFMADLVLQLLSYVAQIERENTRHRQAEGIAAAQARGVKFGRPPIARPCNYESVKAEYLAGHIVCNDAASQLGVCNKTFTRWLNRDAAGSLE